MIENYPWFPLDFPCSLGSGAGQLPSSHRRALEDVHGTTFSMVELTIEMVIQPPKMVI
jgi:hypothetical protein